MKFDFLTYIKKQDKRILVPIALFIIVILILIFFGDSGEDSQPIENTESKLEMLCSQIDGVGECQVMVTYRNDEVFAVAVICEGAESIRVKEKIVELITSIYGIGSNRVTVQPLAKKQ